jgi:hypothetical protein
MGGTQTVVLSRERYQIEGTIAYCVAHKIHMKHDSINITQVLAGSWVWTLTPSNPTINLFSNFTHNECYMCKEPQPNLALQPPY